MIFSQEPSVFLPFAGAQQEAAIAVVGRLVQDPADVPATTMLHPDLLLGCLSKALSGASSSFTARYPSLPSQRIPVNCHDCDPKALCRFRCVHACQVQVQYVKLPCSEACSASAATAVLVGESNYRILHRAHEKRMLDDRAG